MHGWLAELDISICSVCIILCILLLADAKSYIGGRHGESVLALPMEIRFVNVTCSLLIPLDSASHTIFEVSIMQETCIPRRDLILSL